MAAGFYYNRRFNDVTSLLHLHFCRLVERYFGAVTPLLQVDVELRVDGARLQLAEVGEQMAQSERGVAELRAERGEDDVRHRLKLATNAARAKEEMLFNHGWTQMNTDFLLTRITRINGNSNPLMALRKLAVPPKQEKQLHHIVFFLNIIFKL
jgi:hypothetical protein